jgi:hypothetical protein
VAKKKGTRKAAPRGARKKSTSRRTPRKAASRPRAPRAEPGLEHPRQLDLKPLKRNITAQIERLKSVDRSADVDNAMRLLTETKTMLSNACVNTRIPMVIEF